MIKDLLFHSMPGPRDDSVVRVGHDVVHSRLTCAVSEAMVR